MNGRPASAITGLGTREVRGRSRAPSPPPRSSGCIVSGPRVRPPPPPPPPPSGAADPLVDQSRPPNRLAIGVVAAVDEQITRHPLPHRLPVERRELGPFGDEDHRVGAVD